MFSTLLDRLIPGRTDDAPESNSRSHERLRVRMRVQVIAIHNDAPAARPKVVLGRVNDISESGARLRLPNMVDAETLWIRIPDGPNTSEFLECRVCWTKQHDGQTGMPVECGVTFQRALTREEFDLDVSNAEMSAYDPDSDEA